MNLRIFAATEMEIAPLRELFRTAASQKLQHSVAFTITGPGLLLSTFGITRTLMDERPDAMIQVGVAGSFSPQLPEESVVITAEEMIGDSGVMESGSFKDLFDLGLVQSDSFPFHQKKLMNPHLHTFGTLDWPQVVGITVNEMTTDRDQKAWLIREYGAAVESLEGAAFHYAGLLLDIPFIQVRGISNKVGERDKTKWRLSNAITSSCHAAFNLMSNLQP